MPCQPGTFFFLAIEAKSRTVRLLRSAAVITVLQGVARQSVAAGVYIPPWVGTQQINAGKAGGTITVYCIQTVPNMQPFRFVGDGKNR